MVLRVATTSTAARVALACALLAALAGCGSSMRGAVSGRASADPDPSVLVGASAHGVPSACLHTALGALGSIVGRVYREGIESERTATALAFIRRSIPLREAVERGDPAAARAAAQALIATGHLTDLRVWRGGDPGVGGPQGSGGTSRAGAGGAGGSSASGSGTVVGSAGGPGGMGGLRGVGGSGSPGVSGGRGEGQILADVGTPGALAPLRGTIRGAGGAPIGAFAASVWTDAGFITESDGITQSAVVLREHGRTVAGSLALGPGEPPPGGGTVTVKKAAYAYISLPAAAYPDGHALRVYILKPLASLARLCGPTPVDTLVNTLTPVAHLIYDAEAGGRAQVQVQRVQHDQTLLQAVAARDPIAARAAIAGLLHEHLVRLRVLAGGRLLADVGGPYVLAPVRAPLRLQGHTIGSLVLSIQDDEGYKRLAGRLAGLDVLMYMGSRLVKNSLGPNPPAVPAHGTFHYRGHTFRAFTLHAMAFPSGPLRIVVLIPLPYI